MMKPIEDSRLPIIKEIFTVWNDILTLINKLHTKNNRNEKMEGEIINEDENLSL